MDEYRFWPPELILRGFFIMPMTIPKAVEILKETNIVDEQPFAPDLRDAIQLGIEAIKVVQAIRNQTPVKIWEPLPGETSC